MDDTQVYSADRLTMRALGNFRLKVLKDLFGPLLPYTTKRILELRQMGRSSKDIETQIELEKKYFEERNVKVDDSNLQGFNASLNACYRQASTDAGLPERDMDELIVKNSLGGVEGSKIRRRAQDLMSITNDPRRAFDYYILEKVSSHRRRL